MQTEAAGTHIQVRPLIQTVCKSADRLCVSIQKAPSPHPISQVVSEDDSTKGNLGFIHAFVASISVIIVSELGDKTFFIAAIMAMRYNRLTVLAGAMLALGLMTCLSGE